MVKTKILYAEDDRLVALEVKEALEEMDMEVQLADNGQEAVDKYLAFKPDLLLLDVEMPVMDGFKVAEIVRMYNPNIPVLFYTGKDEDASMMQGNNAGGHIYFLKVAYSARMLVLQIKQIIRLVYSSAIPDEEVVPLGRCSSYTFASRELNINGVVTELRQKEGHVFFLLCKNLNQIVETEALLKAGWGNDDKLTNQSQLHKYISHFRDLLKADPLLKIETLRNVGYCLNVL